jgi:transposase
VKLLITLPGVDVTCAVALLAALGDIRRFRDGDHAASYLGLVPSIRQSAEHAYPGHITKAGNGHARWVLVQAAQRFDRQPGPLGAFFRRLARKKNRNVAVLACARKLVVIAYELLVHSQPYRYALTHQRIQVQLKRVLRRRSKRLSSTCGVPLL